MVLSIRKSKSSSMSEQPYNYTLQCDGSAFGGAAPELGRWA